MKSHKILTGTLILLSVSTQTVFFSGCDRAEDSGEKAAGSIIGFKTSFGEVPAAVETRSDDSQAYTFELTSEDGSIVIPVTVVETEDVVDPPTRGSLVNDDPEDDTMPFKDFLGSFKASAYHTDDLTSVFNPELQEVTWDGSDWHMDRTYYWPQATSLDFYARANMPSGEYAAIVVDKDAKTQKLTYTVPTDTRNQKDILMAVYSGTGDNEGKADLTFYHPLTAVQFSRANSLEISGITEIIMAGVNYGGEVTQSVTSPETLSWTVSSGQATVSQDNDGKPFEVHGDIDGDPFLLVPQTVTGTRSVVLTVTLIYNGHEIPLNAIINNVSWQSGRTYTYKVGYSGNLEVSLDMEEQASTTMKANAIISNVGVRKCYVRAIIDGYVTDEDGYIKRTYLGNEGGADGVGTFTVADGTFGSGTWNTNWVIGDDGFYYYTIPLDVDNAQHDNPAAKTTPLFNSYVFDSLSAYEYYEMNISTQAIEWDASKSYVKEFWGTDVAEILE